MANGGARPGAGRPKGSVSRSTEEARLRAAATGELPLDYMLKVLRDPNTTEERRDDMAKAAAPYLHAKLASVTVGGDRDNPIETYSRIERVIVDSPSPTITDSNSEDLPTAH